MAHGAYLAVSAFAKSSTSSDPLDSVSFDAGRTIVEGFTDAGANGFVLDAVERPIGLLSG